MHLDDFFDEKRFCKTLVFKNQRFVFLVKIRVMHMKTALI